MSRTPPDKRWLESGPTDSGQRRVAMLLRHRGDREEDVPPVGSRQRVWRRIEESLSSENARPHRSAGRAVGLFAMVSACALFVLATRTVTRTARTEGTQAKERGPEETQPPAFAHIVFASSTDVSAQRNGGAPGPATRGQALVSGTTVKTSRDGRSVVRLRDLAEIALAQETSVVVFDAEGIARVHLETGKLLASVHAMATVPTLDVIAGRWSVHSVSGRIEVERVGEADVEVQVLEGSASISNAQVPSLQGSLLLKSGARFSSREVVSDARAAAMAASSATTPPPATTRAPHARPSSRRRRPQTPPVQSDDRLYLEARQERNPTRAIALFDEILRRGGPWSEVSGHQAAHTAMRIGDCQVAADRYAALLERYPAGTYDQEARLELIECQIRLERFDLARKGLDDFLVRFPNSERLLELRFLRAELARRSGRCDAALPDYMAALASRRDEDARYLTALCHLELDHRSEGLAAMQRYLDRYPSGRYAHEAKGVLDGSLRMKAK